MAQDLWSSFETVKAYCQDKSMQVCSKVGHRRKVLSLEWSADGAMLASGGQDSKTLIYRLDSDKAFQDSSAQFYLDGHSGAITALNWNPQKPTVLCTASEDEHVYLWDIGKYVGGDAASNAAVHGNVNNNSNSNSNSNNAMDVDGGGGSHSSASTKSCKPYHIIKTGHPLNGIAWSHDGNKICISDRENTITLVDGHKYTELRKHKAPSTTKIHSFKWTNDDKYIVATTKDGFVKIFDANHLEKVHEFQAHCGNCFCIDIASNNQYLATGGADSMITIFDVDTLIQKYGLIPFETAVNCLSFNFNNKLIASSSDDYFIDISYIDDAKSKTMQCMRINTKSAVHALRWHPSKHMLAYCGYPDSSNSSMINTGSSSNDEANNSAANVNIW
eukprot:CAMPEP_0197047588 /NCGR_PEP_ID=MMETSP1384-20130603/23066_1 /TAXON_ID=29189 /ORGANISM="Ammonia sp." /LENGTH=387 /DNA_ID=CAMNT_0042479541 /DNA_START=18 /DNA_END=1178 /DNA_ORIENTATION=-